MSRTGAAQTVGQVPAHAALVARNLGVRFDQNWALEGLDLSIHSGKIHGLVGHNGSGKSTFIKVLAGYYQPTRGTVSLGDHTISQGSPAQSQELGLRFVHQDLGLVDEFSALENFGVGGMYTRGRLGTIDWHEQRNRLNKVLEMFSISLPVDSPVGGLTAVERSLVAIARAVGGGSETSATRFLVLDEPTTALEGPEAARLFRVIRELARAGVGVLFVSHQLKDVLELCDVVSVLRNGQLAGTFESRATTHAELVRSMLGEEAPAEQIRDDRDEAIPQGAGAPALEVSNLRSKLLRGVDLSLWPGECVCVLGLAGSGREEFVYALAGAIDSHVDRLHIDGRPVGQLRPRDCADNGIALVPGNRMPGSLISQFTVRENLTLISLPRHKRRTGYIDQSTERRAAQRWIDRFDIRPKDAENTTAHLSGGNKQKVVLAKWLAIEPSVMLIDEPTAGVDIGVSRSMIAELRRLVAEGISLLVTTSEIDDAIALADRVVILSEGRISTELARESGMIVESVLLSGVTAGLAAIKRRHTSDDPTVGS
jgi:ribose transport system ATP-binding protein